MSYIDRVNVFFIENDAFMLLMVELFSILNLNPLNFLFDTLGQVHYRRHNEGDHGVVEHFLPLIHQFQCHINVQITSTSHIFQYLFKYINKGVFLIVSK